MAESQQDRWHSQELSHEVRARKLATTYNDFIVAGIHARRDLRLHIRYSSGMPSRTMIGGIVLNWLRRIPAALCDSLGEPHQEESSYEPALPPQSIFLRQLCANLV